MATGQTLRLSSRQTLRALEDIDLLELLAERLTRRARAAETASAPAAPPRHPNGAAPSAGAGLEETAVDDPGTGARALLPTATLRLIQAAGLAALASRELVAPGVVTAAVVGSGLALRLQVGVLARYLPALSHIALSGAISDPLAPLARGVLDQLELAGIGWSTAADPRRAALGASLYVIAAAGPQGLAIGPPAAGALLVNAGGTDLPREVLEGVDRVYVDDLGLLESHRHRDFVRTHLTRPDPDPQPLFRHREGWYRHPEPGRGWRRVEADLGGVLTGTDPGRTDDDEILLVELLGTEAVDSALARRLYQAAACRGLGSWIGSP